MIFKTTPSRAGRGGEDHLPLCPTCRLRWRRGMDQPTRPVLRLRLVASRPRTLVLQVSPHPAPTLCHRPEAPSTWLRVAIEKPFGSNLSTAKEMADAIAPSLAEDELYRVDHYIGKRGVQQIAAFRRHNAAVLGPLWHSGGVERVEIVMTETESCEYVLEAGMGGQE